MIFRPRLKMLALTAVLAGVPAVAQAAGDAAAGELVSNKCQICHSLDKGVNKMGPSLYGVVGRKSGEVPDYHYSAAMKASNLTWDAAELDKYLTSPRSVVPGTKMIFPGLPSATDRADLIAFLAQNGSATAAK